MLAKRRALYLKSTNGQPFGRPASGEPAKYLLTNMALCGMCGGPLRARSGTHGNGRRYSYGCSHYHERGRSVCTNKHDVPMEDANTAVIEALLDEVLDKTMLIEAVDEALVYLRGERREDRLASIDKDMSTIDRERRRYAEAISKRGALDSLLDALQEREARLKTLEAQRAAIVAQRRLHVADEANVRDELLDLANEWRRVLVSEPMHARPIIATLLEGRVTITPTGRPKEWELAGTGTLSGLFTRAIFPSGWRPHRDSNPGFSLERAAS